MQRNRALVMHEHEVCETLSGGASQVDGGEEWRHTPSKSDVAIATIAEFLVAITYRHTVKTDHIKQSEENGVRTFSASLGCLQQVQSM